MDIRQSIIAYADMQQRCRTLWCRLQELEIYGGNKAEIRATREELRYLDNHLLELTNQVEGFIEEIKNPELKLIVTERVLGGRTWQEIADILDGDVSADDVRQIFERFIIGESRQRSSVQASEIER